MRTDPAPRRSFFLGCLLFLAVIWLSSVSLKGFGMCFVLSVDCFALAKSFLEFHTLNPKPMVHTSEGVLGGVGVQRLLLTLNAKTPKPKAPALFP